jgi:hypothetical protein
MLIQHGVTTVTTTVVPLGTKLLLIPLIGN